MLRPPNEVYQQVPLDSADGGDVIYQHSFGDTTITAQFAVGTRQVRHSPRQLGPFNFSSGGGATAAGKRTVHLPHRPRAGQVQRRDNPSCQQLVGAFKAVGLASIAIS
jgi:hypothetical protein